MPFVQGTSQCGYCHSAIDDVTNVFQCPRCWDPESFFHSDCMDTAARQCPRCRTVAGDEDAVEVPVGALLPEGEEEGGIAWSVAEGAGEGAGASTAKQVHDLGDEADVPTRGAPEVTRDQFLDFLRHAPDPIDWRYAGWRTGGHVLSWTGTDARLGQDEQLEVLFHVHCRQGPLRLEWDFGGAWIPSVHGSGLSIGERLGSAGDTTRLEAVVTSFWPTIRDAVQAGAPL